MGRRHEGKTSDVVIRTWYISSILDGFHKGDSEINRQVTSITQTTTELYFLPVVFGVRVVFCVLRSVLLLDYLVPISCPCSRQNMPPALLLEHL